jgi:hypothetical protein
VKRIRVPITVEVDEKAWAEEYEVAPGQVRDDVIRYVTKVVDSQLTGLGLGEVVSHR